MSLWKFTHRFIGRDPTLSTVLYYEEGTKRSYGKGHFICNLPIVYKENFNSITQGIINEFGLRKSHLICISGSPMQRNPSYVRVRFEAQSTGCISYESLLNGQ